MESYYAFLTSKKRGMSMKKYDVFLFDADGTLFDYDVAEDYALKKIFASFLFEYSENIHMKYREINSQLWELYEKNEVTQAELQTLRFKRLFDYAGIVSDEKLFNEQYLYELGKGTFLIPGAAEICKAVVLKGKRIYIVTNGILATQQTRIEQSSINGYISGFFVSEPIGFQKPHLSYFEYVFANIPAIDKEKTLIIGDSLSADIAGGNNASIDSCWLNIAHKKNDTDIKPTYEIFGLSELYNFID